MRRLLALLLWLPFAALAQEQAALVADRVSITGTDVLVAQGNVEVVHKGRRLRAQKITYDASTDRLVIDGPIVLTDPTGSFIIADQADLKADLTEGILTSARLVLNRQLQLAASEIMRVGDRYTRLGNTVASSCKICANSPTPMWEIRARRVIHDQLERQLYFDGAQLRFGGIPVFWVPRLRIPDPTLDRATGFLIPDIRSTSELGTGIRLPYFIRLGPSRDLTVTPFLSTRQGRTLDLRYRQAFRTGKVEFSGAFSRDAIRPGENRGYLTAKGAFTLPRGFELTFSADMVSDRAYLLDYGISDEDRLEARLNLTRTRRDEFIQARLIHFHSIREGDVNSRLPSLAADLTWERRFRPALIGGVGGLRFQTHSHRRASDITTDSDGDGISDGRDTARASVRADWRRDAVFGPGVIGAVMAGAQADAYDISQDAAFVGPTSRVTGAVAVELRWPLTRQTARGASQVLEPVVQLVWASDSQDDVPVEDSVLAEFDEGNLFSIDRLPGNDGVEHGVRANVGLAFTHYAASGWSLGAGLGRVLRPDAEGGFSTASGLGGSASDWLAVLRLQATPGLSFTNRLVFDDSFDVTKGEMRLDLARDRFTVASSYVWVLADPAESRPDPVSELVFDGRWQVTPAWAAQATTRYDFEADRTARAGFGLEYRTECLKVDLSLSRRFTSSTSVRPTTDVGLSVELLGFGGSTAPGPARPCRG